MNKQKGILKKNARIAIINRGEAAIRFIRAVNDYNFLHNTKLSTIAFYIPNEENSLFVKRASEAYNLKDFEKKASTGSPYLNYNLLLNALKKTKCDAVWPGWGFVAEDDNFVSLLEEKEILFLGPSAKAMAALGDKIEAKKIAEKAKVPILPWSKKAIKSVEEAQKFAEKIGYPVILKAANAGGGRGIRMVKNASELKKQFISARDETIRITNNDHIFMERMVEKSRHLEVQTVVDSHGNVNTFGVRDCSVQRRNQKVIEETPPPNFSPKLMEKIQKDAAKLLKVAKYRSAGTVEFIYDVPRKEYYFMEVNTRLQVEHPISEQIYQVDLVQAQLDVAFGKEVKFDCAPRGHSVEVRLNAEDPENDFIPAPGLISVLKMPAGSGIRVDSGVEQHSEIPTDFDSMIAKIISYAPTREMAMAKLKRALQEMHIKIEGGITNRAFLLELLNSKEVVNGIADTKFIERFLHKKREQGKSWHIALVSCAIESYLREYREELQNFQQQFSKSGYLHNVPSPTGKEIELQLQGNDYVFFVKSVGGNVFHINIDKTLVVVSYLPKDEQRILIYEGKRFVIQNIERGDTIICEVDGVPHPIEMDSQGVIKSAAPAMVIDVVKKEGDTVQKGDVILTLEAMKMETAIFASESGVIKSFYVQKGEQVAAGQPLVAVDSKEQDNAAATPKSKRVDFKSLTKGKKYKNKSERKWEILEREFLAIFLGYDAIKQTAMWGNLQAFVHENPSYQKKLYKTLTKAIEIFISIESLFSSKRFSTESSAQALNCQELLAHFFKRTEDREKGLPEAFIQRLEKAIHLYTYRSLNHYETTNRAIFRIYKSYANSAAKASVLQTVLFSLKDISFFQKERYDHDDLGNILDRLIRETQLTYPSLVDGAFHARYHLVDGPKLGEIRSENRQELLETFDILLDNETSDPENYEQKIINSGNYINFDLINLTFDKDTDKKKLALELLAKRFNRYRKFHSGKVVQQNNSYFYHLKYTEKRKTVHFILGVISTIKYQNRISDFYEYIEKSKVDSPEVMLFVSSPGNKDEKKEEDFIAKLEKCSQQIDLFYLGFFYKDLQFTYRTLEQDSDWMWTENEHRRYFSPLIYNELRVARLCNFHLELLYRTKTVYLLRATAKDNKKDQRIFVLCNVTDTVPQYDEDHSITAIPTLEHSITEAIYVIRTYQAAYGTRLYWNRIIMHIRSPLDIKLKLIEKYAKKLAPRFYGLGLEKTVIYAHTDREKPDKEMEFLFENISGLHFSIRGRQISNAPLEPMDYYVAKNVRCRRRGIVYPYELIKMLTRPGHSNAENLPRGVFKELDLQYDEKSDQHRLLSVADRPYGKNKSNIIFGTIINFSKNHPYGLKRVLILGDPSGDMGSLAEDECRRINAAIDFAQERNLPVEWIPISSGARIDMQSGTENLDWTASTLRKIIEFTQQGGEINMIVAGTNVGAQSYWNAEATMLMHTAGLLIMTSDASMLLTGKKALDFSGSVSAGNNLGIGGAERIMAPNGQAQIWVENLTEAYQVLFRHYDVTYRAPGSVFPMKRETKDPKTRSVSEAPYQDSLGQGFTKVGDIFSIECNRERKKPFDMRQIMEAVVDRDFGHVERWQLMKNAEIAVVWETRIGGYSVGLIGIESRPLTRIGPLANDGPETWNGGTLFPKSSQKIARAINSYSDCMPLVILANLSGFDGSPESLRNCQLEYGAEIGRAVVNFKGPIIFVVTARYHGGAYVVFSRSLNPYLRVAAIEGTYASVIGGAPAAAVVFPKKVQKDTYSDLTVINAQKDLVAGKISQNEFKQIFQKVYTEKQNDLAQEFDSVHSVKRAQAVGSIHDIISAKNLRPYIIKSLEEMTEKYLTDIDL
ncbi:carboxyl transferase domain-containing protein [Candidatus Uabimicrobium sp. HlEnr_7]|uniref:ATP-binding protein n=1 Tax=Candidatus Uabimicrobium helgolandensis TaxID=3095367 RepID=UPI003556DDB3